MKVTFDRITHTWSYIILAALIACRYIITVVHELVAEAEHWTFMEVYGSVAAHIEVIAAIGGIELFQFATQARTLIEAYEATTVAWHIQPLELDEYTSRWDVAVGDVHRPGWVVVVMFSLKQSIRREMYGTIDAVQWKCCVVQGSSGDFTQQQLAVCVGEEMIL